MISKIFKKWSSQWLVEFLINPNKTGSVNFKRSETCKSHADISFGHTINYVDRKQSHCHLVNGLIFLPNGCWSEHILKMFVCACTGLLL